MYVCIITKKKIMKKKEVKTIKKLKLNKETVSILNKKMKSQLVGGNWAGQSNKASQLPADGGGC